MIVLSTIPSRLFSFLPRAVWKMLFFYSPGNRKFLFSRAQDSRFPPMRLVDECTTKTILHRSFFIELEIVLYEFPSLVSFICVVCRYERVLVAHRIRQSAWKIILSTRWKVERDQVSEHLFGDFFCVELLYRFRLSLTWQISVEITQQKDKKKSVVNKSMKWIVAKTVSQRPPIPFVSPSSN